MKISIAFLILLSVNAFSAGIQDIKTLDCKNEYESTFSLNANPKLINVNFLGRQDGLVMKNIANQTATPIELIKDYFQNGIIALSSEAASADGLEGKLSVLFAEEQLYNVKEEENLSVSFHNSKNDNFYVENFDCVVKF